MDDLCTYRSTKVARKFSSTCTNMEDVKVTPRVKTKANRATPEKVHIDLSCTKALHTTARVTVIQGGCKRRKILLVEDPAE